MSNLQTQNIATIKPQTPRRALIASLVGTVIEWYDFFLYGVAASLVFNHLFFPSDMDPFVSLLLSYATFGIPFFFRPLGGVIFSHIGDRIGRKKTLVFTIILMGVATVLIGVLPGYAAIGIAAPILLTLLRVIQGIGLGGEWGGAILLAVEYSPKGKRGLYGSIPQMGVPIGLFLGTIAMSVVSVLPDDAFMSWGWRIPFLLSAILVIVGLWIRKGVDETPAFKKVKETGNTADSPLLDTLRQNWKTILIFLGIKVVEVGPFYLFTTYIIEYATKHLEYSKSAILNLTSLGAIICALMIPLMGHLSDRYGRKAVFIAGTIGIIITAFPYFYLISLKSNLMFAIATIISLGIAWSAVTALLGTLFSEAFNTNIRYTGITVGYQLGSALFGGTAPMIAAALVKQYQGAWTPLAIYLVITGIISLISIFFIRETHRTEMPD
ncbi:metabolite-proton symporter [Seinonella peptonophila]|uniref:Putative proline/betaine transporter n=1 Tax=Seinonella peptonophila TaxID=112248 RepID=A0A1M4VJJ3_9BACL|nr:MFS transporter [Seinonella peptonophila]SHE69045.1 metabolite-proton symporter [Seinonella peptonophila]